jgi:hypothetical protein
LQVCQFCVSIACADGTELLAERIRISGILFTGITLEPSNHPS